MPKRQPRLPAIWLISDARNDALLDRALARLPRGSGFIFRHYHLPPDERRARFRRLARKARARGHLLALAGTAQQARRWGARGAYGAAGRLARGPALTRLVTVHSLRELRRATRADAVLISPVFATRSHPGGGVLGPVRFRLLAARAGALPVALGGMNATRARRLGSPAWAAIDGLCPPRAVRGDS